LQGKKKTGYEEKDEKGLKMFLITKLRRRKVSGINQGNDSSGALKGYSHTLNICIY